MLVKNSAGGGFAGTMRAGIIVAFAAFAVGTLGARAAAADSSAWIKTWSASPQPTWGGDFPLPTLLPFNLSNQTVRQRVRVSLGGGKLRIVLSNEYGNKPLAINSIHMALPDGDGSAIGAGSDKPVTFSRSEKLVIPAGAQATSDPVELSVPNRGDLVVSFFVSAPTLIDTFHWDAEETGYIGAGDQVSSASIGQALETTSRFFLTDVLVEARADAKAVVAFGDSITDGAASGLNINARWPDFLAERFVAENVAVVNAGISGARLLNSKMGENAAARFTRDVISVPNVTTVVVIIGINDIAWQAVAPSDPVQNKEDLIAGYRQLIAMAHTHNIRIVAGTLTPFRGALKGSPLEGYYSLKRDELRQQINDWIRTSGEFDAVVDLDRIVADPSNPLAIREGLYVDHLHFTPEGNKLIADALTKDVLFGGK